MTGQQLTLELDFWLERPRRTGARGWAPEVPSLGRLIDGRRAPRVYVCDRRGVLRLVRTIRLAGGGRWL